MKKKKRVSIGDVINVTILLLFTFICFYPFWYIFIGSISSPAIATRTLTFLPKDVTLYNYIEVMNQKGILRATGISVARTVIGTVVSLLFTAFAAYLFTLRKMPARKIFYRMVIVTMYFSAGLIPTFLVYKGYGLLNSFWVYVIPGALSVYNMILIKTFIENGVSASLCEAAQLDGAGYMKLFFKIILPISKPILATIALFCAVNQWNSWYDNMIYNMVDDSYNTLQYMLYLKLNEASKLAARMKEANSSALTQLGNEMQLTADSVRMTMTMIVTIPVLCVYPFLQKHFVKGIMIGAVKG